MNEIDQRLALEFEQDAEWKAYQARVVRTLSKRNAGRSLSKEDVGILADYQIARKLTATPKHAITGETIRPILNGYNEAAEAFGLTRDQLYGMRSRKCPAFAGNAILTATLAAALEFEPNPKAVPLNTVHKGAKGKLTPALQASIITALRSCPVLTVVAGAHGITASCLSIWRRKGEAGEKRYVEFFHESEAAMDNSRMELLRDIATNPDWKAKLAVLERTDPERFGRTAKLEHTGKDGGPIVTKGGSPPPVIINLSGVQNTYAEDADNDEDDDPEDTPPPP